MVQNAIIVIVIALCAWFIGRRLYRQLTRSKSSCGCGCTGCSPDISSTCQEQDSCTDHQ